MLLWGPETRAPVMVVTCVMLCWRSAQMAGVLVLGYILLSC